MRWVHIAIVVLFAAATPDIPGAEPEIVSMDFLGCAGTARRDRGSFYLLGAITGSSAYALLRRSVHGACATSPRNV